MARWLETQGFARVSILDGGLSAWQAAGLPTEALEREVCSAGEGRGTGLSEQSLAASFLPGLADRYLHEGALPARRRLATLFVDIAGSTRLLASHPPEVALGAVQRFMRLVTDVALAYCGDVKDFEGDGALLYFESAVEATRAALAIRAALDRGTCDAVAPVRARMSLTVGDVVLGVVGSTMRQAIALVGPSVNVGARLLKQIQPGGIIAGSEVVEAVRPEAPALADQFRLLDAALEVQGTDGVTVAAYELV